MTDAKQKPRELTEQEFHWLYLEGKPVNQSYAATTIHKDRLIELMDMKANYDKLLVRIEKLRAKLKNSIDAHAFTANNISKIQEKIFPKVDFCECEGGCSCKYPEGFIELTDLHHHCLGSIIVSEEFLKQDDEAKNE